MEAHQIFAKVDLHCHTTASFDGAVQPLDFCRLAELRGLTHIAITDHDVITGALRARDDAPGGLKVIVGQEVRSQSGDVIALFIEERIPSGLSLEATVEAIRAQRGLVGLPHPFDARRPSVGVGEENPVRLAALARLFDFVEVHNGRVRDEVANARAATFSRNFGVPAIAASDAHKSDEIGSVFTTLRHHPQGPADLLSLVRSWTQLVVQQDITYSAASRYSIRRLLRRRPEHLD